MEHQHIPSDKSMKDAIAAHYQSHRTFARNRLAASIALTGGMMVVEAVYGFLTNSLALLSDAGHMLTHFFALAISLIAIILASIPPKEERSFGFYRAEIISAFINGLTMIAITGYIVYRALLRFIHPELINDFQMLLVAAIGLFINLVTAFLLKGYQEEDINIKGAFVHVVGDTASSVGIVAGAIVMHYTGWFIVDPILSVLISILILIWAGGLLRDSLNVLLESAPRHINIEEVKKSLQGLRGVLGVHDVHIWEITSKMYAMSAHVEVEDIHVSESMRLSKDIARLLEEKFDIEHPTMQFETPKPKPHNENEQPL